MPVLSLIVGWRRWLGYMFPCCMHWKQNDTILAGGPYPVILCPDGRVETANARGYAWDSLDDYMLGRTHADRAPLQRLRWHEAVNGPDEPADEPPEPSGETFH